MNKNDTDIPENPREMPGFRKKSFSMFFGGGEIWFEHLDGIYDFESLVIEKLNDDSHSFLRPSMPSLICFNLDETYITSRIIDEITEKLTSSKKQFTHACFVGVDGKSQRILKKRLSNHGFALSFIDDFEKAKEWLVSDGVY